MLRKLLKHEFRATARIMLPLYLILLVTAVGANFSTRGLLETDNNILNMLGGLLVMAFTFAIMGVCLMSLVLMVERFRKNLLGDEGYVMLTLPASIHQHVWAKLIVSAVWFFATAVAVAVAGGIMAYDVGFVTQFFHAIRTLFDQLTTYYALNGAVLALELLVLCFLGCVAFSLQFYAAMAVGHSFANHKQALSLAFFFGFQFAIQALVSIALICFDDWKLYRFLPSWDITGMTADITGMAAAHLVMGVSIAMVVAYGAVFYCITTMTLKKRLNLE